MYQLNSLSFYLRGDIQFFKQLLEFYCFVNNETIPIWFGNCAADRFCTLLRRVGNVCRSTYSRDEVSATCGNFIKDDDIDILFE